MEEKFHKTIVFTKVLLKGFFRYEDPFQVYPLDLPNMPFSKLQSHFPLVLELATIENWALKSRPVAKRTLNLKAELIQLKS